MKFKTVSLISAGILGIAAIASAQETPQDKTPLKSTKEKVSYTIGMNIGSSFRQQGLEVEWDALLRGIKDAMAGKESLLTEAEARDVMTAFQKEMESKQNLRMENNKKAGETFLAENKKKEGVKTLASGLQYKVIKEGTGPIPKKTDTVVTHYRGTLINGNEFDSSYKRKEPTTFGVGQVIAGWTEALQLMKVGSKWQLFVPPNLAYGEQGAGGMIGPGETLIFDIELLSIAKEDAK